MSKIKLMKKLANENAFTEYVLGLAPILKRSAKAREYVRDAFGVIGEPKKVVQALLNKISAGKVSAKDINDMQQALKNEAAELPVKDNLEEFYDDLCDVTGADFDSFDDFEAEAEFGYVVFANVASDNEYEEWCSTHNGDDSGYSKYYMEEGEKVAKEYKSELEAKGYTGFDIDCDRDDVQVFLYLDIDGWMINRFPSSLGVPPFARRPFCCPVRLIPRK